MKLCSALKKRLGHLWKTGVVEDHHTEWVSQVLLWLLFVHLHRFILSPYHCLSVSFSISLPLPLLLLHQNISLLSSTYFSCSILYIFFSCLTLFPDVFSLIRNLEFCVFGLLIFPSCSHKVHSESNLKKSKSVCWRDQVTVC